MVLVRTEERIMKKHQLGKFCLLIIGSGVLISLLLFALSYVMLFIFLVWGCLIFGNLILSSGIKWYHRKKGIKKHEHIITN